MLASITKPTFQSSAVTSALSAFLAPPTAVRVATPETHGKAPASFASERERKTGTPTKVTRREVVSVAAIARERHFHEQAAQAERIAAGEPVADRLICLTHSHLCQRCNRSYQCKSNPCLIPEYDISRLHKCQESLAYRKRMAIMLSYEPSCKYGCKRECNHPPVENE